MPKTPIVSFVIPVYQKAPEVFERCLRSLFDMSLKEIEVIAVFDGRDKELEAVAKRFPKVKQVIIEHGGACKARNAGTKIATGKYVSAWDADCFAKPEMAKRWLQEFDAVPDADFVYSGYELTNEGGASESEPFDVHSLTCGNYISSMAPIKRERAPLWDETLDAAQDWDFWLTAVENGCKGAYIPGSGFVTDAGGQGISSEFWAPSKRNETMRIVREKHGLGNRPIGVFSTFFTQRALKIAKILGADLIKPTGKDPRKYEVIFNLGYGGMSRFEGIAEEVTKFQYWLPHEIEVLPTKAYETVKETVRVATGVINLCNTQYELNKLEALGVKAQILPLPIALEDLKNVQTKLPEEFSALVLTDEAYGKLLKELQQDLPHIKFGIAGGKTADYSAVISFYQFAALDEPIAVAHVNGRNVISNIQAPYCGYIDPTLNWDEFKKELYAKIREVRSSPFNALAQAHYTQQVDPLKFRMGLFAMIPSPKLEVVS